MSFPRRSRRTVLLATLAIGLAGMAGWWGLRFIDHGIDEDARAMSAATQEAAVPEIEAPAKVPSTRETVVAPETKPQELSLRIVSYPTREPVPDATVELASPNAAIDVKRLKTGGDGMVACRADDAVGSSVKVAANGYCPIQQTLSDVRSGTVELQLVRAGSIHVRVLDEQRTPTRHAIVAAYLANRDAPRELRAGLLACWPDFYVVHRARPSWTNDAGEILLDQMPCGLPLRVTASLTIPSTSAEITIDPVTRHAELELAAAKGRCIHGRLVWENGAPIDWKTLDEGIKIESLDKLHASDEIPKTYCGSNGEFKLCDLPSGRVNWRIDWPGEYSRCASVESGVVEVGDIVLRRPAPCEGRVYLANAPKGFSYSGIFLTFFQDGRRVLSRQVESSGKFKCRLLTGPVRIDLRVMRDLIGTVTRDLPCGEIAIDLDPFVGRLRVKNVELDQRLRPFLKLDDVRGEPSGVRDRSSVGHVYSLAGTESIIGWSAGDLCAWFLTPGTFDVYAGVKNEPALVSAGRAVIRAGEECVLDASKHACGSIRGIVRTSDGAPIARTSVTACPSALVWFHLHEASVAATDEHGEFSIERAPAGRWLVFPSSRGPSSSEAQTIDVDPGAVAHATLTIDAPGAVEGVVKRYGSPIDGATVSILAAHEIVPTRMPRSQIVRVKPDGYFKVADLAPGRYGWSVQAGELHTPTHRHVAGYFEVRPGETTRCDIDLDFGLTTLHITRDGLPASGIDEGYVASASGLHQLECIGEGPTFGAKLPDGPCLFYFTSKDVPILDWTTNRGWLVAWVPHAQSAAREIDVDIGGATIVVRRRSENVAFPRAYLDGIGDLADVSEWFAPADLSSTDDLTTRRFAQVPVGATVVIESDEWLNSTRLAKRVTVGSAAEIDLLWPPD